MGTSSASYSSIRGMTTNLTDSGKSFAHTNAMRTTPRAEQKVHESLDPKRRNTFDEQIRECLDSTEHPLTIPCAVLFDETGSMGQGAYTIQEKLATLKGATLRAGLTDLQLLTGAYGDASIGEVAPVQIGQFESGDEQVEWLNNIFIEGAGGSNGHETAGLAIHFLGSCSRLDSLIKRGKKGYLLLTGDETTERVVTANEQRTYLGFAEAQDLSIEEVIANAQKSYDIYMFLVNNYAAKGQRSEQFWGELLGKDHVIIVEDLDNIAEIIAMMLAVAEGLVDTLDDAGDLVKAEGADDAAIKAAGTALTPFAASRVGTVAKSNVDGKLPDVAQIHEQADQTQRL